ncbi:hypothetical protein CC2G_009037 [Coprinopsis cinerea AmutBmut pab1-1]|nr:hypothetical protein CC2G_009037 [Coprinopsis cinerea AmutBmut pab1-1]
MILLRATKKALVVSALWVVGLLYYDVWNVSERHLSEAQALRAHFDLAIDNALHGLLGKAPPKHTYAKGEFAGQGEDAKSLCIYLAGKRILLVGPETTYHLHDLWLRSMEQYQDHALYCPGAQYCAFHHICNFKANASAAGSYDGRKLKLPSNKELRETNSALVQYSLSSALSAVNDKHDPVYIRPNVDPATGVRVHSYYWLRRARKAHIVILNRGPIPSPARSYSDLLSPRAMASFIIPSLGPHSLEYSTFQVALETTLSKFLPSLLDTLEAIGQDAEIRTKMIIWQGHWSLNTQCTNRDLPIHIPRVREFWSPRLINVDPWTFFHNAQVYIHNRILPPILEQYNISFLPLDIDTNRTYRQAKGKRKIKDCIRDRDRESQRAKAFFSNLSRILKNRS